MSARENAKDVLVHYFKYLFERSGQNWSADNQAEVEGIVDDIIDATREHIEGTEG